MIKTALALIQALKHFRSRISELDRNGQDTTEYRNLSHGTIQVLCDVLEGSTKPESAKPLLEALDRAVQSGTIDGGPGSGNHGHKGVKGQRGGSAPGGSSGGSSGQEQGHEGANGHTAVSARGANAPCTGFASKKLLKKHISKHRKMYPGMTAAEYEQHAIDFLKQPCSDTLDGFKTESGEVVRFNRNTGEFAKGVPGGDLRTCFIARFNEKTGTANLESANRYFDSEKKKGAVDDG